MIMDCRDGERKNVAEEYTNTNTFLVKVHTAHSTTMQNWEKCTFWKHDMQKENGSFDKPQI